jgi:hypothetical protein
MKAKVLIPFRDKVTKKIYKKNEIIDVTVKRFNEIIAKGKYIQLIEENTTTAVKS